MTITAKIGDIANCPSDRGEAAYSGPITHISEAVRENIHGIKFQWVTVEHANGKSRHVWPSHRLGFMVDDQPLSEPSPIREQLLNAMGGEEAFRGCWSWRSHSPERRAKSALDEACDAYHDGLSVLSAERAEPLQVKNWIATFVKKWVAYMQAGARTANPMITGPANFPAERNRKCMETEQKRATEFWHHANGAAEYIRRQARSAEKAALSEEAKAVDHKEQQFGDVRVVYNKTLERIQLIFPDKPDDETRAILKGKAFRWSQREGAWQRKLTRNGVWAAESALNAMGIETKKAA